MAIVDDIKAKGVWLKSYCIGDEEFTTRAGKKWGQIKGRCLVGGSHQLKEPSYIGCTMSENFKNFQFFADWYTSQIGYSCSEYELDKDILFSGNKIYSEDTCVLVPQALNKFLVLRDRDRGKCKLGVFWNNRKEKYVSQISVEGKRKHLGYFNDEESAYLAYKTAKENHAKLWCDRLKTGEFVVDSRVIDALEVWSLP